MLRETTPFGDVPGALLARIAALARVARYGAGTRIYSPDDPADDLFIVVSGRVEHVLSPELRPREAVRRVARGGVFGWTGLLLGQYQAARHGARRSSRPRCCASAPRRWWRCSPPSRSRAARILERFTGMIQREFTVPELLAKVRRVSGALTEEMSSLSLTMYRASLWLKSPRPYLMLIGFALFLGFWYLAVEVWRLPRFREMPGTHRGGQGVALAQPDLRPLALHRGVLPAHPGVDLARGQGVLPRHRARRGLRPAARLVAQVQGLRVPGVRDAAADPDPGLGAARHRDVHRHRVGGGVPRLPRLVLRHRAQHHARRGVDRRVLHPRGATASARTAARCSAT